MEPAELESVDLMDPALFADGPPHELFAELHRSEPVLLVFAGNDTIRGQLADLASGQLHTRAARGGLNGR